MEQLGRYKLERVIGRGAMGVVYEGWDEKLKRKVAVKTIQKGQLLDPDMAAEYTARFTLEAQNAGQLIHPNIVTVFDFGNEADVAYLVMEFIQGKELKTYLDAGHVFGIGEAVVIACQLLEALDYVHGKGIFHRDIKPANVMLEPGTNRVRLTDFGVARMSGQAARDGTMVGTPSYMSPEQIKGLPAGAAADLFATGVLLYQSLTLHKPFAGKSEWEIWQRIVHEDPAPMSHHRAEIPPTLEQAVRHALAKDPGHRPPSARAMIDELKWAIGESGFDPDATRLFPEGSVRQRYERELERLAAPQVARRLAEESARSAVARRTQAIVRLKPECEEVRPVAEPGHPQPSPHAPALAASTQEDSGTAADEVVMQQIRAQLVPMGASANRAGTRRRFPRIVFSEHWRLPAIGIAGGLLVSATILLGVSSLFESSKPRKVRGALPSGQVDSPAAPAIRTSLPMSPPPLAPKLP